MNPFFEYNGEKFAIGLQFIINLCKFYNEDNELDSPINEVLSYYLGDTDVKANTLSKWGIAFMVSLNTQRAIDGKEPLPMSYYDNYFNDNGFKAVSEVIMRLAKTTAQLFYHDNGDIGAEKKSQ